MLRYTHKHREDKKGKLRTAIAFTRLAIQEIERGRGTRVHFQQIRSFLEEHPKHGFTLLCIDEQRYRELANMSQEVRGVDA